MAVPTSTTVLIIGGGPGGSYTASVLAREGVDCVVLEAVKFPRYHIGESMLSSMRHFLQFIDLDQKFSDHGFQVKRGAAFKLNDKREGFTDFLAAGGLQSWNVIRSEADDLMFRHAGSLGAKIFDEVKVESIRFEKKDLSTEQVDIPVPNPGRPVEAVWSRKDGTTGCIKFDYLVDASGRQGLISTKYLKNRKTNEGLKNLAYWGYWKGTGTYGQGTIREGVPFFEAIADGSGWAWTIPLHDGTLSVGIVQNQAAAAEKKRRMGSPTTAEFYKETLKLAPRVTEVLGDGNLTTEIKAASDWSYSASCYSTPYLRIVGDAGCFIDPYFSSGVHLALASALSAATTIRAAQRGDIEEMTAMKWHSGKIAEGYTRFLLVVMSAMQQIREKEKPILSDWDEDGFERAFAFFRPIIQGHADANTGKLTQDEVSKTVDFCLHAFEQHDPEKSADVMKKIEAAEADGHHDAVAGTPRVHHHFKRESHYPQGLDEEEMQILNTFRARQMLRSEDIMDIESFHNDSIEGLAPRLERGRLTLVRAKARDMTLDRHKMEIGGEIMGETIQTEQLQVPVAMAVN